MSRPVPRKLMFAALAVLALIVTACGSSGNDDGSSAVGTRTVNVEMRDIAFSPKSVDVHAGETVRFVFHNKGKVAHDAFIGDGQAQDDHEMEMRESSSTDMGMNHGGSDEGGITVAPGETGELTHTFKSGDKLLIGCHQSGHYAAGMKMTINVS